MPEFLAVSLNYAAAVALIVTAAAMVYGLFSQARATTRRPSLDGRPPVNPILRPAIVAISGLGLGLVMIELVHWHVRSVAARLLVADANPTLTINGAPVAQPEPLLETLRSMHVVWPHHSAPTTRILVEISSDKGAIRLELARDSDRPDEYWVTAPRYWTTTTMDVARLHTRAFDQY